MVTLHLNSIERMIKAGFMSVIFNYYHLLPVFGHVVIIGCLPFIIKAFRSKDLLPNTCT